MRRRLALLGALVAKDLRRRWRQPVGFVAVLAMPVVFAGMLALTFGGGGDGGTPTVHLLLANQDEGAVGQLLGGSFGSDQLGDLFEVEHVEPEAGRERLEEGEASALLILPEGLTEAVLDGEQATVTLVRNPAQGILPEIAEQVAAVLAEGLDAASALLSGPLGEIALMVDDEGTSKAEVLSVAAGVYDVVDGAEELLFPPAITYETVEYDERGEPVEEEGTEEEDEDEGRSTLALIFSLVLPGISVYALFLVGDLAMRDLLTEAEEGTLVRQLSAPIGAVTLVVGKALHAAVLATVSLVMLSAIGWAAAPDGVHLGAFALLSAALVLAVTGFGAAAYGVARDRRQGATGASVVLLVMAFSGGSFIPLESLPETVVRWAPLSLFYWPTEGYKALLIDEGGVSDVLPAVGILAAVGTVLLALGGFLLDRRIRRGVR